MALPFAGPSRVTSATGPSRSTFSETRSGRESAGAVMPVILNHPVDAVPIRSRDAFLGWTREIEAALDHERKVAHEPGPRSCRRRPAGGSPAGAPLAPD